MTSTVSPSREDGAVRAASEIAGGPAGSHVGAGRHGFWWAGSVLVVGAVAAMGVALVLRQHCRRTLWASPDQFTHACYSDVPTLFTSSGMGDGVVPYLESSSGGYLQQPLGTGWLLWLLGLAGPDGPVQARWVFDLGALLVTVALVALVVAVVRLSGRRPWDAALVALSPVLLTASLVSLDLVAVALALLAVLAFARRRPALAGVLLGLGVTVRPIAALVLVGLGMLALRSGVWRPVARTAAVTGLVLMAVNVPLAVANVDGWAASWAGVLRQPIGYGSMWLLPQLAGRPIPSDAGTWIFVIGMVPVLVAALLLALGTPRRPRLPAVLLVLVVGTLMVSPAISVQAALWVLPFAALAVPRWRDLLVWAGAEVVYGTVTWLYVYGQSEPERGAPGWLYALVLVVRLTAMGWLVRQAVVAARDPWHDPVRSPSDAPGLGRDDPCAGDIEDAPDALVVRFT